MDRYFGKKKATAVLFLIVLFTLSILTIGTGAKPIKESLDKGDYHLTKLKGTIDEVNSAINENFYGRYKFIEAYGYLQSLMDKNEESNFEVIKDNQGKLQFTYFAKGPNPTNELTQRVVKLGDHLSPGTKLTYVMTPDKYIRGYSSYPKGIPYNYNNETADQFLSELKKNEVDTLDLREGLLQSGIAPKDLFFTTDHHWKIETAFWAFGQLVKHLDTMYPKPLDPDGFYTSLKNYNDLKYSNVFIGSLGRKTGKYYAGADDFSLIYPKFKTNYSFYFKTGELKTYLSGRFEEALLTTYPLNYKGDEYGLNADKYFTYLYGNQGLVHIVNRDRPNGLKVMFIKDSVAVPMISFLSTVCSEVYLIDPRYYKEDIFKFVDTTKLDHVFVSISPQDLVDEFFPYGRE